jgi:large repetitive protein
MKQQIDQGWGVVRWGLILLTLIFGAFALSSAHAFTVSVTGSDGAPVAPFRWMVEEDNTNITVPGMQVPDGPPGATNKSIGIDIHNSYAPVVASGHSTNASVTINLPSDKPYFVTVMPDGLPPNGVPQYAISATTVAEGQNFVQVKANKMPIPTAQIYLLAFIDHNPISNAKDEREDGLGGVSISLFDFSGGKMLTDGFGNELGTIYETDIFGEPLLDPDGVPIIKKLGDGDLTTMSQDTLDAIAADPTLQDTLNPYNLKLGEALIKNLAPGKYGVRMVPPAADDDLRPLNWSQTATIEGTPTIDAWVKAKEPKLFVEGFGTGVWHAFFGFVNYTPSDSVDPAPWMVHGQPVTALQGNVLNDTGNPAGTGSISGKVRFNHFDRPPNVQGLHAGIVVDQCFVGLNDAILIAEPELVPFGGPEPPEIDDALKPSAGLYVTQCNPDGTFTFTGIPPGDYQIVTWDAPLDALFGFHTTTVPPGAPVPPATVGTGEAVAVGDLLSFRWFGSLEGIVFNDIDADGIQDPGEIGIGDQAVLLRFRDGTIYQENATDTSTGRYAFTEIFPFFKWQVAEVDFARFKAVSMATAIDNGGEITSQVWPANGNKSLQPQDPTDPANEFGDTNYRRETGPVLTQGVFSMLTQTNLIDWGKQPYGVNENGGISGVVFYDTTRAEDDPRYSAGEPWQPGIPRVQMNLYTDFVDNTSGLPPSDGIIDDQDGFDDGAGSTITLADIDNHPFNWAPDYQFLDDGVTPNPVWTGIPGPEDVDRNYTGQTPGDFDLGDAVEFGTTDSWDDNKPSGCIQNLPAPHGFPIPECADAYGTWTQVRPAVFDGGYAFGPDIDCESDNCSDKVDYVVQTVPNSSVGYLKSGNYIVEAVAPPNILVARSEDKNVDFGEIFIPSPLAQPPVCVGDEYTVPAELTLFPGVPANLAGDVLNHCDRKAMNVAQAKNAAVDFFMYTPVPKAARVMGFANNDLGAEFNQASPIFGEKLGVPWVPVAWRDWAGNELFRTYTDEWGNYNAMLPSTYTINVPSASGVAPNMITMVLNDPIKPDGTLDDWYNPDFSVTPWTFNYQPGATTYTDTPMVPVAAFTTAEVGLDTEQVDGGPVIYEVYASAAGAGTGPMVCTGGGATEITLVSSGPTWILNPDWDPTAETTVPREIERDYGFGPSLATNSVTLDGVALTIVSWDDASITAIVPAGATTGRLTVKRGDTGIAAELGLTLHVIDCATETVIRVPGDVPTIQAAIDAAGYVPDAVGALILVAPGTYNENVIMNKPVRLQGAGTGSTFISANPIPLERLDFWHDRIEPPLAQGGLNGQALEDFMLKNPFSENEAPGIIVFGEQFFPDGVIGNFGTNPLANVFNPGHRFGTPDNLVDPDPLNPGEFIAKIPFEGVGGPEAGEAIPGQSLIDGFTLSGSKAGGGIYIFTRARGLQVSNNNVTNNQGNYAGGISVGVPDAGFQMYDEDDFRFRTAGFQNSDVAIVYNKIHRNSGFQGAGGIAASEDSKDYLIKDNIIIGNFSRFHGGGIAHIGRSDGGTIQGNKILFNENFFGAILLRAGDGGGIYMGGDLAGGTGAGFDLTIDGNLIQGNMTGSGSGGGIRIAAFSGLDVRSINDPDLICESSAACPEPWPLFNVNITNNIIVDNVAGLDGGGISLQDVSRAFIANNTIANNDSTQVGREAFPAGSLSSIPAPAGVSSHPHSDVLAYIWNEAHGQPGLGVPPAPGVKVLEFCIQGHPFEDAGNPNPSGCFGEQEPDYTTPELANNIVWHNNSWFFNGTTTDPGTGALVGSLDPNTIDPHWDLGVDGGSAGQVLNPQNSILSSLTGPDGVVYNGANLASDPLFVSEYDNVLEATTVIDEGGNNINIRFTPFPGSPEVNASDYHISAGSPAINAGTASADPLVALDFDRGPRPVGGAFDIGADEYLSAAVLDEDSDSDGVFDSSDNCTLVENPNQRDTDGDGFGNFCDTDVNNDGITNGSDVLVVKEFFLTAEPDADFNGDNIVNGSDILILKNFFLMPPGPSGVTP